jgi:putative SOS response-associated peptidase YedK
VCGRYGFYKDRVDEKGLAVLDMLRRLYPETEYKTGEICPGDLAPGVIRREKRILPVPARFGFPGFDGKKPLINARSETVTEKKAFAESIRERRIVLPASGFYEWSRDRSHTKYYFTLNAPVFYLCGLYRVIDGEVRFVILTRQANESMIGTHDRMPVTVDADGVRPYLTDFSSAMELIAAPAPMLHREKAG